MQSTGFSSAEPIAAAVHRTAAVGSSSEEFKKHLTGTGVGQMNLRAVKERGNALRKSLEEFIDLLQYQPEQLSWEYALERFGVMGVRHQQLAEQLRPLLKFYVAHPKAVNQSNAEVIPLLLSTMRLPEIDAEEDQLLKNHEATVRAKGLANFYEQMGNSIEQVNKLVDELTQHHATNEASGSLDPKGPRRRKLAQELQTAVNRLNAPPMKASHAAAQAETGSSNALIEAALTGKGL